MDFKKIAEKVQTPDKVSEILQRPGGFSESLKEQKRWTKDVDIGLAVALGKESLFPAMRPINSKTTKILIEIDNLFEPIFPRKPRGLGDIFPNYDDNQASPEMKDFFSDKIPRLMYENLDIEKSVKRGFRDMIKGEPLKSEMFRKIKSDLIDPLKEYLSNPDSEFSKNNDYQKIKEQMLEKLNQIEAKHFGVQKGGRGG